jgi:hypothetical protein
MDSAKEAVTTVIKAGASFTSTVLKVFMWIGIVILVIVISIIVWLVMSSNASNPNYPTVVEFGEAVITDEDKRRKETEKINIVKCNAQFCTDGSVSLLPAMRLKNAERANNALLMKRGDRLQVTARAGTYELQIHVGDAGALMQCRPRLRINGAAEILGPAMDGKVGVLSARINVSGAYFQIEEVTDPEYEPWKIIALPTGAAAPEQSRPLTEQERAAAAPLPSCTAEATYHLYTGSAAPTGTCGESKVLPKPEFPTRISRIRLSPVSQ